MDDKLTDVLVVALRQARAEPGEQRLYKSGKLSGLFASRSGAAGNAAARALREGLLDVTRTEAKGKTAIEWVRLSARGQQFLNESESPLRALEEVRRALTTTAEGVPLWLANMQAELHTLGGRLADDAQRWLHTLDALSQRVDQALRRVESESLQLPNGTPILPWAGDALAWLERRRVADPSPCPLPELFAGLREKYTTLSLGDFHDGLRLLQRSRTLRLTPFAGPPNALPEPEYALLDGAAVLYFVERTL
jgi:hypothetical protein